MGEPMKYSDEHLAAWRRRQEQYEDAIESGDFLGIIGRKCPLCQYRGDWCATCRRCVLGPEEFWCISQPSWTDFRMALEEEDRVDIDRSRTAAELACDWLEIMRAKAKKNGVE